MVTQKDAEAFRVWLNNQWPEMAEIDNPDGKNALFLVWEAALKHRDENPIIADSFLGRDGEFIRPIIEDEKGGFYISENHTIADIYRWTIEQRYWPEMVTLHELESEKV